jgi:hypothetical protein
LLFEVGGEGRLGGISQHGVRPSGVVILDPSGDFLADMGKTSEQRLVEQLVTHPSVEAHDERVLVRFDRCAIPGRVHGID